MDTGTGVALGISAAGLFAAIAFGLPAILSFLREGRDQNLSQQNRERILVLEDLVKRSEEQFEVALKCFDSLASALVIHHAIVRETVPFKPDLAEKAGKIFHQQTSLMRKSLFHLKLLQADANEALRASFQLATVWGGVDSIKYLKLAEGLATSDDAMAIGRHIEVLENRLNGSIPSEKYSEGGVTLFD